MTLTSFTAGATLISLISVVTPAQAVTYTVNDLGVNITPISINNTGMILVAPNSVYSSGNLSPIVNFSSYGAVGINDAGQVVGSGQNGTAIWRNGIVTPIGSVANSLYTASAGIDTVGDVAGTATFGQFILPTNKHLAALYSGGRWSSLGTLGGSVSAAAAISGNGIVAGTSTTLDGSQHLFLYQNGKLNDYGAFGIYGSSVSSVNNSGEIVGSVGTNAGGNSHAFMDTGGRLQDLGTLLGPQYNQDYISSYAYGVNNLGQIVGSSEFAPDNGNSHAILYTGGKMLDLNSLIPTGSGWSLTQANAINDQGQIVGFGTNGFDGYHAFLLTPNVVAVPEAGSMSLSVMCFVPILFALRARRKPRIPLC